MPEIKTHWKLLTNPNYLGAYSLPNGQDIVVVIDYVRREEIVGVNGKKEYEVVAHLKNGQKPFILNKTNMKQIQKLYNAPYIEDWAGRAIQVYFDPTVTFGREKVGGLRIRPTVPQIAQTERTCADCGKEITGNGKFSAEQIAQMSYDKYGKSLCWDCSLAEKQKIESRKAPDALGGNA
ncbi:MAG: hypothetical protein ACI4JV_05215 [Ruminiclostridium sp.]|jgi:hypothetical protein